jgi:hypothetical protein
VESKASTPKKKNHQQKLGPEKGEATEKKGAHALEIYMVSD